MNTTPNTFPVMTSLKALWHWLMAAPGQTTAAPHHEPAPATIAAPGTTVTPPSQAGSAGHGKPVRVLQVLESGQTSSQMGRLRISGRMADVCAELDRLAAREALLH
ncbi:hypothetical protein [Rhodoferax sp.]|uniref:hypothetical protein n=1 Tax=Rhodoferax sp. TaxID=50421 RepID=UPI002636967D|nr:hypothetical protein [Rhodoferax sp.]MDD2923884.1 hypothetical protein [Rhodoferax sp.]